MSLGVGEGGCSASVSGLGDDEAGLGEDDEDDGQSISPPAEDVSVEVLPAKYSRVAVFLGIRVFWGHGVSILSRLGD
jgi:hypothetical protein